ncbi:STAS domain-containing protein [Asanoa sp. NPDC049518]|uniref:STAS domain-containing protein n=1 Tax=unclassified Asanoa TaxID=2685164 RepID=UPI00343BE27C
MNELSFTCEVHRHTTTLTVHGTVESDRTEKLGDAIAMASIMRTRGPIVVDVTDVDRLSPAALAVLRRATNDAGVAGRRLTVRAGAPAPRQSAGVA